MLNFSSLATQNTRYIPMPSGGTFMAASDRAKLLKNSKVWFGEVQADMDAGRLAIGSADDPGSQNVAYVRRGRLYE
jgi:hypothetical protein